MTAIAKLRHLRIAPRKVRQVSDLIRGKKVTEAQTLLKFLPKKASLPLAKLLKSATDSAKSQLQLEENNLYISKITVDEGPKLKRWQPRARGQAYEIQKKTSHVTIALEELEKRVKKVGPRTEAKLGAGPVSHRRGPSDAGKIKIIKGKAGKTEEIKKEKPKFKPEIKAARPRTERGTRKIFKRKSF